MSSPRNIVVVSDLHCGCRMGLCPPGGAMLDGGGRYEPSLLQRKVWGLWRDFWDEWVPLVTKGEPYAVIVNGDALDGNHHGGTSQISHNLADQANIAYEVLKPIADRAAYFYHVRGTPAHVGPQGAEEERLAQRLGAIPGPQGEHAHWVLWRTLQGHLIQISHHMGGCGSLAYEATAFAKELTEALAQAAIAGLPPPKMLVRAHRHRGGKWDKFGAEMLATPGWQLPTEYSFRLLIGRTADPEIGGAVIRVGDDGQLYSLLKVWRVERPPVYEIGAEPKLPNKHG